MTQPAAKRKGNGRARIFALSILAALTMFHAAPARAGCTADQSIITMALVVEQHMATRLFITDQFKHHQNWLFGANEYFQNGARDGFWELHVQPAMMMMTEQLVTIGMEQMLILGTFFDAKNQLDTQQLFQKLTAQAHKDYHPSFDMCVIGTTARGLASADRNGEFTSFVLSQRSQDRQMGMYSASGAGGSSIDREGRIRQVQDRYCDPRDNSNNLMDLCGAKSSVVTINKDIDYTRTVDGPRTLNIDFTDGAPSNDEQDVLALASNLFSYEVLDRVGRTQGAMEGSEGAHLDMRTLIAKRSVAENSFNAIIGLKTAGTEASEETILFTQKLLEQFGVTDEGEREIMLGGTIDTGIDPALRPSYYAQLEVMAQKIYQDPEFYSNLYDKPTNVLRKNVAMKAVNLMLGRDMYKSELRSEMGLSVLLEMELMKYQEDIQNRMNSITEKYREN